MSNNTVVLAAAGSRKTEHVVDLALQVGDGRVLIATYTQENQRHIARRIKQRIGVIPPNVEVSGWFGFLMQHCAKPYQRILTERPFVIDGLNFLGQKPRFIKKCTPEYYLDRANRMYRDSVADFAVTLNRRTNGAVVERLERVFTHIFVDEVQDLVGYDLDLVDLLLESKIKLLLVGDLRQHTISTNKSNKNKKFRGRGLKEWFACRQAVCKLEERTECFRCNQSICDFADSIYPEFSKTKSVGVPSTGHDGVFAIAHEDVPEYVKRYEPIVLRHNKIANTLGFAASNIGVCKGRTFDRVLVFPTKPMLEYLKGGAPPNSPDKLYVAVSRARYSVAFAVPDPDAVAVCEVYRFAKSECRPAQSMNSSTE